MNLICEYCNITYKSKHSPQRFCSRHCANLAKTNGLPQTITCEVCGKTQVRAPSKLKSKSGIYFCSRDCKCKAQRTESQVSEIVPFHYGKSLAYKAIAFRNLPHTCSRCNYQEHPEILQVHHKDKNRQNNNLENLEILCPNRHAIEHWSKTRESNSTGATV